MKPGDEVMVVGDQAKWFHSIESGTWVKLVEPLIDRGGPAYESNYADGWRIELDGDQWEVADIDLLLPVTDEEIKQVLESIHATIIRTEEVR